MAAIVVQRETGRKSPGEHQQFEIVQIWDKTEMRYLIHWVVRNSGSSNLLVAARMRLNHSRGFFQNDEEVIEYDFENGITLDKIGLGAAEAVAGPWSIPPGDHNPPFTLRVPGVKMPFANSASQDWWLSHENSNYNFIIDLYEIPSAAALLSQGRHLGRHEFKGINVQLNFGVA